MCGKVAHYFSGIKFWKAKDQEHIHIFQLELWNFSCHYSKFWDTVLSNLGCSIHQKLKFRMKNLPWGQRIRSSCFHDHDNGSNHVQKKIISLLITITPINLFRCLKSCHLKQKSKLFQRKIFNFDFSCGFLVSRG